MYAGDLDFSHPLHWTVAEVLTPAECEAMIARIESEAPTLATIDAAGGPHLDTDVRNNTRVIFDDVPYAAMLYQRLAGHVPEALMEHHPVGVNERFRGYKYEPGQRFGPHLDGWFRRDEHERSMLTLMVYLNEGFVGGQTAFLHMDESVVPKTGMALLFQHRILHEGSTVRSGVKYALRSDVMYRSVE